MLLQKSSLDELISTLKMKKSVHSSQHKNIISLMVRKKFKIELKDRNKCPYWAIYWPGDLEQDA